MNEIEKVNSIPVKYNEKGQATLVFENDAHFIVNGDFQITAKGEVSVLSQTAISLDCAILLLNCRMAKQIRDMKKELRLELLDILGALPDATPAQLQYIKQTKQQVKKLLNLNDEELSHIKDKKDDKR